MIISSSANPKIKHIRKLSDRKYRESNQQFFCEGLRVVGEALERGIDLEMLIAAPELLKSEFGKSLIAKEKKLGTKILEVSPDLFTRISSKDGPKGIALVGQQKWSSLDSISLAGDDVWVALDSIQDPGNLGTILRTMDASGCKGIILLDHCADPYDPAAMRASMGAVFTQILVKASFSEFSAWVKSDKIMIVASSDASKINYREIIYQRPVVLLMGSEREGLQKHHLDLSQYVVSIPMLGNVDSLNLAVATGIILYEIHNQQRVRLSGE